MKKIVLRKVSVHNLKKVDLELPLGKFIVFTGVSGSGKSSLAFDTIYVEGQRRYVESLSTYARRHMGDLPKPEAESITGISPTIAIEQKRAGKSPRSTVGTLTGVYDYLRLIFARIGIAHCPVSKEPVTPQSMEQIVQKIECFPEKTKFLILSPYLKGKKGEFKEEIQLLIRKGYTRIRLDGRIVDLSEEIAIDGKVAHDLDLVIDRLSLKSEERARLVEAVSRALEAGEGMMILLHASTGEEQLFSTHAYSPKSGLSYSPLEPKDFSFNHPEGMCPACHGLGFLLEFSLNKIIDPEKSIEEDCCKVASSYQTVRFGNIYDNLARLYQFDIKTPWKKLSKRAQEIFLHGNEQNWTKMRFIHPIKRQSWTEYVQWKGVLHEARRRYQEATSDLYRARMREYMEESVCHDCQGARIRPYPAATLVGGKKIQQITALSIEQSREFFTRLSLTEEEKFIAGELVKEIRQRLSFLVEVGLDYLSLDRIAPTLSGGESQRVRLASQISAGLSQATYILDEPSIGLHPRDNTRLIHSLRALCEKNNTVIVVEHDEEMISSADCIVDVGPLAGIKGGEILSVGPLQQMLSNEKSLTGAYLSGRLKIPIPQKRRKAEKYITIEEAAHHNLKRVTANIPLEIFTAITGVSGSGKSSLISEILYPALSNHFYGSTLKVGAHRSIKGLDAIDKVIAIDQSPIGRTPRSNPATYIKLFDAIRDLFAELPESRAAGFKPGRFSFNVREGSCVHCGGMGLVKIDMDFMEDEWVICSVCQGKRFDPKTLLVRYKGKTIYEVLEMTVAEALSFFEALPLIKKKLDLLQAVGLDYIKIGQSSSTLSGGEAQRIKLAKELSRPATGRTLYLLDEPTTGLHFHDINKLIQVLQQLVDHKNSVVVIEHNMDLVKTADWIIDLGPEGGERGGTIVATGNPEQIAKMSTATGEVLARALQPSFTLSEAPLYSKEKPHEHAILITGATQNNLKNFNLSIPHGKITICTGLSGSGKSSLAFETVYAEGQRRYTEVLSPFVRQFIHQMPKPKVEEITGLLAAIAIEQKSHAGNPRSTIGTMTGTYDLLRILYAHLGTAFCPETGERIVSISKESVCEKLMKLPLKTRVQILAPLKIEEEFDSLKERLLREGFLRIRLNGEFYELDGEIPFDKRRKNACFLVIDRLTIDPKIKKRLFDAIDTAAALAQNILVAVIEDKDEFFNLSFSVPSTGKAYPPITAHTFSFNTPKGMCPDCLGIGLQWGADFESHPQVMRLSPLAIMKKLWKEKVSDEAISLFIEIFMEKGIDYECPLQDLPPAHLQFYLMGSEEEFSMKRPPMRVRFIGIHALFGKLAKIATTSLKEEMIPWLTRSSCPSCNGTRLNPLARHVRIQGLSIAQVCAMSLEEAMQFVRGFDLSQHLFLEEAFTRLINRLGFLLTIGLQYLSLDRAAPTLSGGETQRIRLACQLGSGLTGCLYVLDEPTIGLHPHNNVLLNRALRSLCNMGNTLLLVEHDPMTLQLADHVIEFGPKAGKQGGYIVAEGSLEEIKKNPNSLTGAYLSGRQAIPIPKRRRSPTRFLKVEEASIHNLNNLSLQLPLGIFVCLTGVSGSGKSTLLYDLIRPAILQSLAKRQRPDEVEYKGAKISGVNQISKLHVMDQSPIGHTIRADISTYVDFSTPLRFFFAELPEAKIRALQPKHFSFNHVKGMCMSCQGLGTRKISLQFLPPVYITCNACHGFRLNPLSLQVKLRGKHFGQLLQMTVEEALAWIPLIPKAVHILETLLSVGLGYLALGQEINTLSGGEVQRLRLARELSKRSRGHSAYFLDEPSIGLHSDDIAQLLRIFHSLVDRGNSVIVIEHNIDIIANADYLIDLGPEAGRYGGRIVSSGTPEEVATHKTSVTAQYVRERLAR